MFSIVPFTGGRVVTGRRGNYGRRSLLDDFFNDDFFTAAGIVNQSIKADIRETDKEFVIEAELPGVKKEDINLKLDENTISISVEQNSEDKEEKENYLRRERRYGSFSRSFYIENINTDNITAKYEEGVLTVTLPKEKPKKEETKNITIH